VNVADLGVGRDAAVSGWQVPQIGSGALTARSRRSRSVWQTGDAYWPAGDASCPSPDTPSLAPGLARSVPVGQCAERSATSSNVQGMRLLGSVPVVAVTGYDIRRWLFRHFSHFG